MVEGARLESVYTGDRIVGSNPTPSAIFLFVRPGDIGNYMHLRYGFRILPRAIIGLESEIFRDHVPCRPSR